MKAGRAEFLRALIRKLDAAGVAWCCLRNHHEIFEDTRSDVDLMVLPEDIPLFETFLEEACAETGTHLTQEASYLNFSRTYLTPSGQWVRIDYESEIRWRIFPVLQARRVLLRRVQRDGVWVASPADEAVVLWIAALFRKFLSDRYRTRLRNLEDEMQASFFVASEVYREAFGSWGATLLRNQKGWLDQADLRPLWGDIKSSLVLRVALRPAWTHCLLFYLRYDLARFIQRWLNPSGLFLFVESPEWNSVDSIELLWRLDRVFPVAKSFFLPAGTGRLSWRQRLKMARTLFKGGLVLFSLRPGQSARFARHSRGFWIRHQGDLGWVGGMIPGGWMTEVVQGQDRVGPCYQVCLQALAMPHLSPASHRRMFCVLLGLDGSGKTTLARHLAQRLFHEPSYPVLRYFHFLPTSPRAPMFPWPRQTPEPKKVGPSRGDSLGLSLLRLIRNWSRAWWTLGLRYRRFAGVLLGDRYLYNYLLDPASVRYGGSPALAARFLQWAPRPDLMFVLDAPPEVIARRKRELSPAEMQIQTDRLKRIPLVARRVVRLDGTLAPEELAAQCLREIERTLNKN